MTLEEIKKASINKLEARQKEIRSMNLDEVSNYDELSEEIDAIEERKKELREIETKKQELRNKIANGDVETTPIEKPVEERKMELTKENYRSSKEYRAAFLKHLQGKTLNHEERNALNLSGAKAVVPTSLQESILSKAKEYSPILNEITLLHVNGNVKFAVEGTVAEAKDHAENAAITSDNDSLVNVELSTYEITKMLQISASVKTMSIDSFESWLVDMIAEAISMKIEKLIFIGTGTSQAKGIDKITWNAENSVEVAKASNTTAENVYSVFALLPDGYAKDAKVYVSRKTLFNDLLPLMDKSKNNLVVQENGTYYLLGTPCDLTATIKEHEFILGNPKKYVGNMPEETSVVSQFDIDTNSYKYLGVALFDGKPALENAFVKLKKATA